MDDKTSFSHEWDTDLVDPHDRLGIDPDRVYERFLRSLRKGSDRLNAGIVDQDADVRMSLFQQVMEQGIRRRIRKIQDDGTDLPVGCGGLCRFLLLYVKDPVFVQIRITVPDD